MPLPKVIPSNELFVRNLMQFSPYGALAEVFVIEAIRHYAGMIASTPKPEEKEHAIVNPRAWHDIAEDITNKINERQGNE